MKSGTPLSIPPVDSITDGRDPTANPLPVGEPMPSRRQNALNSGVAGHARSGGDTDPQCSSAPTSMPSGMRMDDEHIVGNAPLVFLPFLAIVPPVRCRSGGVRRDRDASFCTRIE